MNRFLTKQSQKYVFCFLYFLITGLAAGHGLRWGLPMIGIFSGVIVSYTMGFVLGGALTYFMFFKWRTPRRTKLIVSLVILAALIVIAAALDYASLIEMKRRTIELLAVDS